jgi:hypothetical protein
MAMTTETQHQVEQPLYLETTSIDYLAQTDFSDYLANLETYEECLAQGEIQW